MKSLGNKVMWLGNHPNCSDKVLMNCKDNKVKNKLARCMVEERETREAKSKYFMSSPPLPPPAFKFNYVTSRVLRGQGSPPIFN